MMGKIIMIGSMKGGVSKTVTTFNLAYSLAKLGRKVLAVDFDSQANLSTCFGVENTATLPVSIGSLMLNQIEDEEIPETSEFIRSRNGVEFIPSSIYIINRENLQWLVEQSGVPFDFDMVVLDELSSFKNWNSKRFKAFMRVRPKVKRIIGLTGTPSSNGLMDLFAEFKCLDMGERLGRFISQYRVNYFVPDQMNGEIVYSYRLRKGAEQQIYDKISDITISMKALDHLKMPELISNEYPVHMSEHEASLYDDMEAEMFLPLRTGEITAANAVALSGKLLQMANGAVYSDDGDEIIIHDQKLDALEDLIEAANGKPVMVAYWYKHDLARIMRRLSERKIPFERLDSEESIRKWNRGDLPVALIHPASAGHGLNLQSGGNILIWFGLTWSLELYQQTVARLWRQGQSAETVVVQHIITAGTIDEQVMSALASKDRTQSALINAVKAEIKRSAHKRKSE